MRRINWTIVALIAGLILLVLLVAYFATNRNSNQDKLTNTQMATASAPTREKLCASKATYDLIKAELFRRAAQLRGSDQVAYDRLAGYAVMRMENPVMESANNATGTVNCSGSLALDLPPGVSVAGGRRTLMSDIDYTVQAAADGSGTTVQLRNADAIVAPLATLARVNQPAPKVTAPGTTNDVAPAQPEAGAPPAPAGPIVPQPAPPPGPAGPAISSGNARPSFSCATARTKGEMAVCGDAGLAALDRNMAAQYSRALATASPEQLDLLRETARRFYAYRDRCPNRQCIGDAYIGRMREIREIVEGRWQSPR